MTDRLAGIEAAHATALEGAWRTVDVETGALGDLLAVVKAARFAHNTHECDECVEDGCNADYCPCAAQAEVMGDDQTCHNAIDAADEDLRAALANLGGAT